MIEREPFTWAGKRVFITGNTGFKGSWLTLWLLRHGAEIGALSDSIPTEPSAWELMRLGEHVETVWADIADRDAIEGALTAFAPEVVFHMAAQPFVRRSYRQPLETLATNVIGTANILDACRASSSTRVIVNVTSDKCYENDPERMPLTEDMPMGGADPYSASKGCAELVASAFGRSFFADPESATLVSVRAGNVVGGGDWGEDRLVPDLMRAASSGDPVALRSPGATRPWQHVVNPLDGYLTIAERAWTSRSAAGGWNFGPSTDQIATVLDVAQGVQERWGAHETLYHVPAETDPAAPHEAVKLSIDSSKAERELGWLPRWGFDETLDRTVAWYRAACEGEDMEQFSLRQLDDYTALTGEALQ